MQEAFPGVADYSSVHNRWLLWEFSTGLVSDNPVLGVGPNGFRTAIEQDPSMEDVWGPHNAVLLLWLNYGLLGVIGYTVYMSVVWRAIHAASKIERSWCGTKIGFVALLVFSLFEPLVGSASFELLIAVLYCQALSLQRTFYSPTNALGDGGKLISPVIPGVLSSSELIVPLHRL